MKIGAREDDAEGSTRVVLFDSLDEVYRGCGSSANGRGGGSHGFIFSFFVVLIIVVVGHMVESVGVVKAYDGRGSVREEKEGASVRVRVSVDLRKRV